MTLDACKTYKQNIIETFKLSISTLLMYYIYKQN